MSKAKKQYDIAGWGAVIVALLMFKLVPDFQSYFYLSVGLVLLYCICAGVVYALLKYAFKVETSLLYSSAAIIGYGILVIIFLLTYGTSADIYIIYRPIILICGGAFMARGKRWAWLTLIIYIGYELVSTPLLFYGEDPSWLVISVHIISHGFVMYILLHPRTRAAFPKPKERPTFTRKGVIIVAVISSIITIGLLSIYGVISEWEWGYNAGDLAAKYSDAVVVVRTYDGNEKPLAVGSGVIITSDGLILTNDHILEGAEDASIHLSNGTSYWITENNERDAYYDLAALRIKASNLPFVPLELEDEVLIGDAVIAIGNPEGLANTVSEGIISGIRGEVNDRLYQTTAPISHGSSGGALVNKDGELIGLTALMHFEGQNLNFAIPIYFALPYIAKHAVLDNGDAAIDIEQLKLYLLIEEKILQLLNAEYDKRRLILQSNKKLWEKVKRAKKEVDLEKVMAEDENLRNLVEVSDTIDVRQEIFDAISKEYNKPLPKE